MYHLYVDVFLQTSGRSALFYGAQEDDLEITKLLIQGGANLNLKDKVSTFWSSKISNVTFSYDLFKLILGLW